ncbi:MAG TPA: LuxR C-terminal-related transcriptional regulator [Chryseolinea sp.]|nr:LuxR C-terminal-related transcriptional regulator [Chryseolinea sp.]
MRTTRQSTANAFTEMFDRTHASNEYAAEQDEEILMNNLRFVESLFPQSGVGLCPVSHAKTHYLGKNCEHILGHSHAELMKMDPADLFGLVHPDDLPQVQQCFDYIKNLKPYDPEKYRFVLEYRIRNKSNEYFVIRNENLALKVTEKTYLYLMLYSRATESGSYHRVKLDLLQGKNGLFTKVGTYHPKQDDQEMTPRQADIAKLAIKGYTNQEIADQLGISLFTIKNHKKTLFRKINVKNNVQLANYLMGGGESAKTA